jgi:hypothetical protein
VHEVRIIPPYHAHVLNLFYLARRLLKSLSIKQGLKYDSPESARDIPSFIHFHGLKVDEILEPISSFSMSLSSSALPVLHFRLRNLQRFLLPQT